MSKNKKEQPYFQKNDIVTVKIDDLGSECEGIGHLDGYAVFIKDALIGETVEAKIMKCKKGYAYARLMEIKEPSPYRVEPVCEKASQCGGCQLQHLSYEKQLEYKENKVKNCLERIGGFTDVPMMPVIGMDDPYYYRNKVQYPVSRSREGEVLIGFYAGRTHQVIDAPSCMIQFKEAAPVLDVVRAYISENNVSTYDEEKHTGLLRHLLIRWADATGELMACFVLNGDKLPEEKQIIEKLTAIPGMKSICININREKTNVILGKRIKTIWGAPYITDRIGDINYRISALSFYQVNPVQTNKLYETALSFADLKGNETVMDLYCGIGTISLFLAKKAKIVYGVEIVPQAIEDAKANAELNQIENVKFFAGAAEEKVPELLKEEVELVTGVDVIVIDPPRKGCDRSLLDTILTAGPERIVYVSCDPATLARDARVLCDGGYELKKVQAVDMFGHTGHVETVTCLHRVNS